MQKEKVWCVKEKRKEDLFGIEFKLESYFFFFSLPLLIKRDVIVESYFFSTFEIFRAP